jgi:hypothetical protein
LLTHHHHPPLCPSALLFQVLAANQNDIEFVDRDAHGAAVSRFSLSQFPKDMTKKVTLLKYFKVTIFILFFLRFSPPFSPFLGFSLFRHGKKS